MRRDPEEFPQVGNEARVVGLFRVHGAIFVSGPRFCLRSCISPVPCHRHQVP